MIHRGDDSLKDAATKAYNQVLFPHHQYNIQKACATGLNSLPSKSLVLLLLGEAELEVALGLSDIENKHGSHCDESPLKLGT
ncbi:hypothetical protein YC2023_024686 [Brassica napus]